MLIFFVNLLLIFVLLVAVSTLARGAVGRLAKKEFLEMPIFWRASTLTGLCWGLVAVLATIAPADRSLGSIFSADSRWGVSLSEFISQNLNPLGYLNHQLLENLSSNHGFGLVFALLGFVFLLILTGLLIFGLQMSRRRSVRIMVAVIIWALALVWLSNSVVSVLLWGIYQLNFWIFFVLVVFLRWPFLRLAFFRPGASTSEGAPKPR